MTEQSPKEIIAAALGAVRFRCVDGTEQVIGQLAPQLADAVMAVLHEQGLVLCRVSQGWVKQPGQDRPTRVAAEAALDVLLSPGEQPCPECGGRGYDNSPPRAAEHYDMEPCPSCHGTGTGVPAIIDAVMEQVGGLTTTFGGIDAGSTFWWLRDMQRGSEKYGHTFESVYRLRCPEERP